MRGEMIGPGKRIRALLKRSVPAFTMVEPVNVLPLPPERVRSPVLSLRMPAAPLMTPERMKSPGPSVMSVRPFRLMSPVKVNLALESKLRRVMPTPGPAAMRSRSIWLVPAGLPAVT